MRRIASTTLFSTFGTSNRALAQGAHDWGMWFGTLIALAVAVVLVALVFALARKLKR
jgi:uncharacterized protein involved in cysteine biosynthesis